VDVAFENIGEVRAAGWKTPEDHPDLVAAAEAGRLADNLRFGSEDERAKLLGDDFAQQLQKAIEKASALEEAIVRNAPRDELEAAYKAVNASCKACHAAYRDKPQ
jgi:cytochrome c556